MKNFAVLIFCALFAVVLISGCEDKAMKKEMDAVSQELANVKIKLASTLEENKGLKESLEDLKAKLTDMEGLDTAKAELEEKFEALMMDKEEMAKDLEDSKSKISSMMDQVKKYSSEIQSLKDANTKLQEMINQLKGQAGGAIEKAAEGMSLPGTGK